MIGESVVDVASDRSCKPEVRDKGQGDPASAGLQHGVYVSFDDVRDLQPRWDAFVKETGGDIFSTFDWCEVWWRHYGYGRQLQIHVFHENGQLVAVLPLFWERLRLGLLSVRLVRIVGCDHSVTTCGPVIQPNRMAEIMRLVIDHLDRSFRWDLLHFGPLPGYYRRRSDLTEALGCHPSVAEVAASGEDGPHIVFDLPESYEAYLASLSGNERSNIRSREKRLKKNHTPRTVVIAPEEVDGAFAQFVKQHQVQWRQQRKLGHFGDWPASEAYHHEMAVTQARHGRLLLLQHDVDGMNLGYQYNYRFGSRVHWILTSRTLDPKWDWCSPGRLLHSATVKAAIDAGATQIDAMRGLYDYKLRLGGKVLQLQSVAAIHRGFGSWARVWAARHAARMLHFLYYRIWFGRLAPRFPNLRRPLWCTWIRSRI
jgi:CelD/BcsL family acetyltransferase involved in cellulose biosynthesis